MECYVVIDLEMCKVPKKMRTPEYHWASEIIQIGAVKLNADYEILDEFSVYVSPRFGHLTPEISRLTGIQKETLKDAPDIAEALRLFNKWLPETPVFVSWSTTDPCQLRYEIEGKQLDCSQLLDCEWIDCQKIFGNKIGAERSYGLENALNLSDIDYRDGIHNGLVDAYNTALLFRKLRLHPDYAFNAYYRQLEEDNDENERLSSTLGSLFAGIHLN